MKKNAWNAKPTFAYDIASYNTKDLPDELRNLKSQIRHQFTITHRSGRSLKDLTAAFTSPSTKIVEIEITQGKAGTAYTIEPGGNEAT